MPQKRVFSDFRYPFLPVPACLHSSRTGFMETAGIMLHGVPRNEPTRLKKECRRMR